MKKILLIGPLPNPITGESLANQTIRDNVPKYSNGYVMGSINMSFHKQEQLGKLSFEKIFFYTSLYKGIFKILKSDIVYITTGQTFFGVVKYAPFIYFAKLCGKQVVVHVHGNHLHMEYANASRHKQKIMKAVLSKADKGIILSESIKHNMTPFIDEKNIYVLYNFVEDLLILKNGEQKELYTDSLRILYLSNLIPEKGIFDLFDALLILKEKKINFTALIAGAIDDTNKAKVQQMLDKLRENVKYLGVVRGAEKKKAFMESNVFVFPTYYRIEGQPIAILEAMATANIVLTTDHAGIPDIFTDGVNGYYVNKKDPQDVADKLIKLAGELPQHREMMLANQKMATEKYTVEKFVRNFIGILEK